MNESGGSQSFDIRLTNQQLRRDAQAAMAQFDRIGQRAVQTGRTIDGSMNNMSRSVAGAITKMTDGIKVAMTDMAKNMVGITALLSSGAFLKSLFDESTAFTRQIKIVSTISDEVANDLQGYKDKVLDLCRSISVAPDTAAAALYQINSAGWLGADGMKVLEASAKAAIGGVTETATAADAITTIMNAYHMSADDAEAISDKLFTTVRLGKTTMDELGRSIAYVAPLAATYKISIDEVLAAVAQLTKQGNSTQNAMTQISASITAVANELGDTAFENGLLPALEEIEKRSNGSNLALKAQLSNIRAVRGALGLTKGNANETAAMLEQLRNSAGATETAFKKLNNGAGAEMRMLRTNFLKELEEIGGGMNKTLAGLAHKLNEAFKSGSMQTMISTLKDLIITYGIYKTLIITLIALNKAYKNVMSQVAYQKSMAAAQQKALNTSEALGAVVTTNLKRAVQSLNAALKANAFGLVIAAVAATTYGFYKLITAETEYEKTQKKVNKAVASAYTEFYKEKSALDALHSQLKHAKKGTEEWLKAKNAAVAQFGKYDSTLASEIERVGDLTSRYNVLTDAINKSMAAKALQNYESNSSPDKEVDKVLADVQKALDKGYFYTSDGSVYKIEGALKQQMMEAATRYVMDGESSNMPKKISEYFRYTTSNNKRIGSFGNAEMYGDGLMWDIMEASSKMYQYKRGREQVASRYGYTLDDLIPTTPLVEEAAGDNHTAKTPAETLAEQMQELIDQARSETDAGKLSQLKDQIDEMLKRNGVDTSAQYYKDLQAALKIVKGKLGQGGDSGKTQAELDAEAVAARQRGLNLELAQNQERANILAQSEIDLQRSLAETQLEGAEKRRRLRELDIEQEKLDLQNQMRDQIQAVIDAEEAKFNAQEEINEKEAAARGNTHYAKRTFTTGNLSAGALSAGDEVANTSGENVGNMSEEAVARINAIMQLYDTLTKNRVAAMGRELTDEAAQTYDEYLRDFGNFLQRRQALIDIANRGMAAAGTEGERLSIAAQLEKDLSALDQEANSKTSAIAQLFSDMTNKTIADMRRIEAQGRKALNFLTNGEWNAETGAELGMSEETFNTLRKSPEELEKIRRAIAAIKREADGAEGGFIKFAAGLKEIFKAENDPKKFQEALGKISEGMQTVLQVAGFLQNSLGQLGEAFGSDTLGDIANGIGIAMDAMDSAMQGAQAGAAFGPWGAAAGAAIGLVSSLGSAIAKLHDAKHEKKIQEVQDQVEVLERAYDKLDKAISKAYSGKAKELIEQQNILLRQKQTLIRQQIAEEEAKKKTDNDKIKEWKQQLEEIEDQIADNKEAAIDAIFGEEISAAIDRFADAYESMFDGGISRAIASKDLVKQMIKNMIIEAMKADISGPMEKLRDMLLGFWSDEKITDWEQNQLNGYVEDMMAEQEKKWGWADGYFKDSTSQSSSKGGFTTMSQDSADELNGRFTALQMAGEAIKATTADINEQLKAVAARSALTASAVDEIRGLSLIAVDHLEAIRKHTANLEEMNNRLGKIEKYTSRI